LVRFENPIAAQPSVALVVLMRLAVTYDLLPLEAIQTIVGLARDKGALVYVDDAGGARVGPSLLVSRGCRSSVSISVRRAWTNTAHRAALRPARRHAPETEATGSRKAPNERFAPDSARSRARRHWCFSLSP
jgi:hypothetical protein